MRGRVAGRSATVSLHQLRAPFAALIAGSRFKTMIYLIKPHFCIVSRAFVPSRPLARPIILSSPAPSPPLHFTASLLHLPTVPITSEARNSDRRGTNARLHPAARGFSPPPSLPLLVPNPPLPSLLFGTSLSLSRSFFICSLFLLFFFPLSFSSQIARDRLRRRREEKGLPGKTARRGGRTIAAPRLNTGT